MKRPVLIMATLIFCLVASLALADTVKLAYIGVKDGQAVTVTISGLNSNKPFGALAGNYELALKKTDDTILGNFSGFCVEAAWAPEMNKWFTYDLVPISPSTDTRYKVAAYILYRQFNDPGNVYQSAVVNQIAVWEIVFDWNEQKKFDLADGNFVLHSSNYQQLAETVINNVINDFGNWTGYSAYALVTNSSYQDYVIPMPQGASPVPIPSPFLLVLSGLLGLFGVRRRGK